VQLRARKPDAAEEPGAEAVTTPERRLVASALRAASPLPQAGAGMPRKLPLVADLRPPPRRMEVAKDLADGSGSFHAASRGLARAQTSNPGGELSADGADAERSRAMVLLPWEPFEDPAVAWEKIHGSMIVVEQKPEGMTEAEWRIKQRCKKELKRKVPAWKPITNDTVTENHEKVKKGMLYSITFPWTEDMLHTEEWGAEWLTKAMHTANTLPKDNRVVKVIPDKKYRITTGNNGGKFLFEVEYEVPDENLHTKLFAKIPHSMDKDTMSDRLSSSVNKQPMELYELNTSRLLEATLPVKIPRFYFGDISNETSNWILITEAVSFHDPSPLDFAGKTRDEPKKPLAAYQIEGPYDKCMDWCLLSDPADYYMALVRQGARMAGLFKSGAMGDPDVVAKQFENMLGAPAEAFGMQPGCSGQPPKMLKSKIDMGLEFFSNVAPQLYPDFVKDPAWQAKFTATLMKLNAYAGESQYWFHSDNDYISLAHANMNVDNA
ncbi:unnamed protein product, partial [Effrenium voratum]